MTQQLQRLADTLTESAGAALERRTSRRNLLVRMTVVGSALSLAPLKYLLRPGSAWAFSTTCSSCSSGICITSHNSAFCCTITGVNHCPSGTTACGVTATGGAIIYYGNGQLQPVAAAAAILGVQAGSWLGLRASPNIPVRVLKLLLAAVLGSISLLMLTRGGR